MTTRITALTLRPHTVSTPTEWPLNLPSLITHSSINRPNYFQLPLIKGFERPIIVFQRNEKGLELAAHIA
jgi:hypothetical protein